MSPQLYDEKLSSLLASFVAVDAAKVLVIILKFAEKFEEIENPWPVLDILIEKNPGFIKSSSSYFYMKTVYYILSTLKDYRDNRLKEYTNVFLNALSSSDGKTVASAYKLLAIYGVGPVNLEYCSASHILDESVRNGLLQCIYHNECILNQEGMRYLVQYASSNPLPEVIFAILKQALTKKGSEQLLINTHWMSPKSKIGIVHAMRIFLAILSQPRLRAQFSRNAETAQFLKRLCVLKHTQIAQLISSIVRILLVDNNSIPPFEQVSFLATYYDMVKELSDKRSWSAFIKTFDAFLAIGYSSEYVKMIPSLKKMLQREDQVSIYTVSLIANMSNYQECASALTKYGFPKYFAKLQETGYYNKEVRMFQKNLKRK